MGSRRDLDVVVYGATGFTGRLIAEYFARLNRRRAAAAGAGRAKIRWAVAGRTETKLVALRGQLRELAGPKQQEEEGHPSYPLVIVASDPKSMLSMASRTSVVISAAGPYLSPHGLALVGACVEWGTDYVDITGETPFVRRSMDLYHRRARQTGSYVVHMCGFDSVPSDLGTWHAVRTWREKFGTTAGPESVRSYAAMRGQLSGGTLASGIAMEEDPDIARQLRDPFLLGGAPPPGRGGAPRPEDADCTSAEPFAGGMAWTAPFEMAKLNTRVVRRSASELGYSGSAGAPFGYSERMLVPDERTARKLARPPAPVEKRRALREAGRLPKPGEGPSEEERRKGWFRFVVVAEGVIDSDGKRGQVVTSVSGGEPGYTETAKMVSEAALALVENRDETVAAQAGVGGGVLTPAWLGDALLQRLQGAGIRFSEEEVEGTENGEICDARVLQAMVRKDSVRSKL